MTASFPYTHTDIPINEGVDLDLDEPEETGLTAQLHSLDVAAMLSTRPAPRDFLFRDPDGCGVISVGIGAGVAAPGGSGKSIVLLGMSYALAIGGLWLDRYQAEGPTPVFYFTAEDDAGEIHQRFYDIHTQYVELHRPSPEREADMRRLMLENLHIYCIQGLDFKLTIPDGEGGYTRGDAAQAIVNLVNDKGGSGVAVTDPIRKICAGNEEGAALNEIVTTFDWIRQHTNGDCTTFLAHHSSKASMREGEESQAAFRGATDLVDGLRWTMVMQSLSEKEAKKLGVKDERSKYRKYSFPKSNYSAQEFGMYLKYDRGTFNYEQLTSVKDDASEKKAADAIPALLKVMAKLEDLGVDISARALIEHSSASAEKGSGLIPVAKNVDPINELLHRAKKDGKVTCKNVKFRSNGRVGEAWELVKNDDF